MNTQMQYARFPQPQTRSPATRRPGECAPSTDLSHNVSPTGGYQYVTRVASNAQRGNPSNRVFSPVTPSSPPYLARWQQQSPDRMRVSAASTMNPMIHDARLQYQQIHLPTHSLPNPYHVLPGQVQYQNPYLLYYPGQIPPNTQQYAAQHAQLQNQQMQQRNAVLEHQMAQRRAKKPTDRNMPEGVEDMIIDDGVQQYKDLREMERRLDYTMMRKRLDLQETFNRSNKRPRTLRIWITNTANNQPWQRGALEEDAFDFQSVGDSTVRVKIEGRLLEDDDDDILLSDDDETESNKESSKQAPRKLSHFFKNMTVEFDKNRNNVPDPVWQVEWKKQANAKEVDVIEFQRKCDENINVNINLTRDEPLERYQLSYILASTLDMQEGDRAEVVMAIWEYIRCFNLQEEEDKRAIRCDEQLKQIFGQDQIYFPQIPDKIMSHLHPLPPVKLQYTVRVDEAFLSNPEPTVYDVRVTVEDPLKAKVLAMGQNPEYHAAFRQIALLDDQLAIIVQALQHSKARHTFYKSYAKDPTGFIKRWMGSQRRDLEVILGEAGRGGGEDGSGPEFAKGGKDGVWGTEAVTEAVRYMLARPQAPKA